MTYKKVLFSKFHVIIYMWNNTLLSVAHVYHITGKFWNTEHFYNKFLCRPAWTRKIKPVNQYCFIDHILKYHTLLSGLSRAVLHHIGLHSLPPLGSWQFDVILHTNIDKIRWSPNESTNYSSSSCYSNFLIKRYFLTSFFNVFFSSL
jgi:hypothetical protein